MVFLMCSLTHSLSLTLCSLFHNNNLQIVTDNILGQSSKCYVAYTKLYSGWLVAMEMEMKCLCANLSEWMACESGHACLANDSNCCSKQFCVCFLLGLLLLVPMCAICAICAHCAVTRFLGPEVGTTLSLAYDLWRFRLTFRQFDILASFSAKPRALLYRSCIVRYGI